MSCRGNGPTTTPCWRYAAWRPALKLIEYTPATATASETPLPPDVQSARIVHLSDRHPQQAVLFLQSLASDNNGPFLVDLSRDAAPGARLSKIETGVGDFLEYHFDAISGWLRQPATMLMLHTTSIAAHPMAAGRRLPAIPGAKAVSAFHRKRSFPSPRMGKCFISRTAKAAIKNSLKSLNLENGAVQVLYSPPHADLIPSGMTISRVDGKPQAVVSYFGVMERHFLDESLRGVLPPTT